MIEFMFLAALAGSLIAGIIDLKTTEIPDEIPTLMAVVGIFSWFVFGMTYGNFTYIFLSAATGTSFLVFGWILYKMGQWGGGDAKLMAGIGYLVPYLPGVVLFPVLFFANVFIVGAAYVILYSLFLGVLNRKVWLKFASDMRTSWKMVFLVPLVASSLLIAAMLYTGSFQPVVLSYIFILLSFVMVFWRYAKAIESEVFVRSVPASKLMVGDVLIDSKVWDGITESQAAELRKSNKTFRIKEGVRFGPVFFLALIATLLYGNYLFLIL